MLKVVNRNIYLTRGDSAALNIKITSEKCNQPYQILDGDEIFFTVKESYSLQPFLFQKKISSADLIDGNVIFKILPSDTDDLDFKEYIYDVEIRTSVGDVYTVIPPSIFCVEPEVTYYSNEV